MSAYIKNRTVAQYVKSVCFELFKHKKKKIVVGKSNTKDQTLIKHSN